MSAHLLSFSVSLTCILLLVECKSKDLLVSMLLLFETILSNH